MAFAKSRTPPQIKNPAREPIAADLAGTNPQLRPARIRALFFWESRQFTARAETVSSPLSRDARDGGPLAPNVLEADLESQKVRCEKTDAEGSEGADLPNGWRRIPLGEHRASTGSFS
jgi:hypothetical protein